MRTKFRDTENAQLRRVENAVTRAGEDRLERRREVKSNEAELKDFIFGRSAINPLDKNNKKKTIFDFEVLSLNDIYKFYNVKKVNKGIEKELTENGFSKCKEAEFPFRVTYKKEL